MKITNRGLLVAALTSLGLAACSSSPGAGADSRAVGNIDAAAAQADATGDARLVTPDAPDSSVDAPAVTPDAPNPSVDARVVTPDAPNSSVDAAPDATLPQVCGDGIVETGEDCDDGNSNDFDACNNLCFAAGPVTLKSVSSAGVQGNDSTDSELVNQFRTMNADGSIAVFFSNATNLVDGDTNGFPDVFVHDFGAGTTVLASVDSSGNQGNQGSVNPSISDDGKLVVFESDADNLVDGDTNQMTDVFIHDLDSGVTELVSVGLDGAPSDGYSYSALISADGRFVVFLSSADNLVANSAAGVFMRDRMMGTTTLVSVNNAGDPLNSSTNDPYMTPDGRFVTFWSYADNAVANDLNGQPDIFVRDMQMGTTVIASVHTDGTASNAGSYSPSLSDDGHLVVFASDADNLVDGDANNTRDVFIHDLVHGTTSLVSIDSSGHQANDGSIYPVISHDGRLVAFVTSASNLVSGFGGSFGLLVRDIHNQTTTGLSINAAGDPDNGSAYSASFSADDKFVTFFSSSDNLVPDDVNGLSDFFRRSL